MQLKLGANVSENQKLVKQISLTIPNANAPLYRFVIYGNQLPLLFRQLKIGHFELCAISCWFL